MDIKKIIACEIFTDELAAVLPDKYQNIEINWIDAGLHANLDKLELTLEQALKNSVAQSEDARVLFGEACHPDMCKKINDHDAKILGAKNCIQAFYLEDIQELEKNRTIVMTPGWLRLFPKMMMEQGKDEVDVRQEFGRYDRILVLDTSTNPLSDEEILEFYDLTQVPIETQQISIEHFRSKVIELLR